MAFFNSPNTNEYKSRLETIRTPSANHMSRTRTKIDRFKKPKDPVTDISTGTTGTRRKKKAYAGAYVAEVRRQVESGFAVAGTKLKHLHAFVIDMDLTSLYPSIMMLLNISPKTFVAKLIFAKRITIPLYNIEFLDAAEKAEYKCSPNDFFTEAWVGKHYWALMEIFCKMPTTEVILTHIQDNPSDFR